MVDPAIDIRFSWRMSKQSHSLLDRWLTGCSCPCSCALCNLLVAVATAAVLGNCNAALSECSTEAYPRVLYYRVYRKHTDAAAAAAAVAARIRIGIRIFHVY